jgi:hypothetical protein
LKQVVLDAIANPVHQRTIVYNNTPEQVNNINFTDLLEHSLINTDLLFMYVRYCYGGLPGDMIMLQRFIQCGLEHPLYYCKIHNHDSYSESSAEDTYLLSAVDFHVFPKILEDCKKLLAKKQIIVDTDTIKSTIWNCRSRTNFREGYISSPPNLWNGLLEYLDKESKQYWDIFCAIGKNTHSKADIFRSISENIVDKTTGKPIKKTNNILNYFKQTKSI